MLKPNNKPQAKVELYFTRGRYDTSKSEKRRQEIKQSVVVQKFTPPGINTEEYIRQRTMRAYQALNKLMSIIIKEK